MKDLDRSAIINRKRTLSLEQWTRSSGRVLNRRKEHASDENEEKQSPTKRPGIAEIYLKFLDLQDDNKDFTEALSYGLKLLDAKKIKPTSSDRLHSSNVKLS